MVGTLLAGIVVAFGGKADGTAVTVIGTVAQGFCFAGAAWFFASRVAKPRLWHFGLQGARFWPTLGWAALGTLTFYVITLIYGALVQPDAEQETVEALGGDQGTFGLIVAGTMVIAVAPVVEEFFFRGFFYGALRNRMSIAVAALVDGAVFGIIHFQFDGVDGLLILPPLAVLGVLFCLVYESTGHAAGADRDARVQQRGRVRRAGRRRLDGVGRGRAAGVRRPGGGRAPATAGTVPRRPLA